MLWCLSSPPWRKAGNGALSWLGDRWGEALFGVVVAVGEGGVADGVGEVVEGGLEDGYEEWASANTCR